MKSNGQPRFVDRNEPPRQDAKTARCFIWVPPILLWILAIGASCLFLDHVVSRWLFDHPVGWHHNVWVNGFRQLGKAGTPIWLLLAWSCITNRWRPTLVLILAMILVSASVSPLKAITRRYRPNMVMTAYESVPSQTPGLPWHKRVSFPSGDTAVAFAAAATLSCFLSRLWVPALFAAAGAIATLRVTTLAHYPSDVLTGALIGVLCGLAAARWTARRRELDHFRAGRQGRLALALVLATVALVLAPFVGLASLQMFLRLYAAPLATLVLLYLAHVWRRTAKQAAGYFVGEESASRHAPVGRPEFDSGFLRDPAAGSMALVGDKN